MRIKHNGVTYNAFHEQGFSEVGNGWFDHIEIINRNSETICKVDFSVIEVVIKVLEKEVGRDIVDNEMKDAIEGFCIGLIESYLEKKKIIDILNN